MNSHKSIANMLLLFLTTVIHVALLEGNINQETCVNDANYPHQNLVATNLRSKVSSEYETLSVASTIKEKLAHQGYAWVDANLFRSLLLNLGAAEAELVAIEEGGFHSRIKPVASEPKLFFRDSSSHNVLLDDTKAYNQDSYIATNYPTVTITPKNEISSDNKANIEMERSGIRVWNMPPKEFPGSSVSLAMAKLHKLFLPENQDPQSHMDMLSNTTINTQDFFRVNKHLAEHAEPSSEGIHQDGFQITSVTLIKRHNIRDGGETRIWNLQQPIGYYGNADFGSDNNITTVPDIKGFRWSNILFRKTMTQPWETIVINDRAVKHESRAFFSKEKGKPCYRDVIINNMRKPFRGGIDKMLIDGKVVNVI